MSKSYMIMLKTKNQAEKTCLYEKLDGEFSEIEEELENKLWELHDKILNNKNY